MYGEIIVKQAVKKWTQFIKNVSRRENEGA